MVLLTLGKPIAIVTDEIYALPAKRCLMFCATAAATFFQSNTDDFTVSFAVTLDANGQAELAGGFIKCTSATPGFITVKN